MDSLSGFVEKIKYRNEENGYAILSVESGGEDYVLVGTFPMISASPDLRRTAGGRDIRNQDAGGQRKRTALPVLRRCQRGGRGAREAHCQKV